MPQFALLMREDDHAWTRLPEKEQERLLKLYYAWVKALKSKGAFVTGAPFGPGGRVIRNRDGEFREAVYGERRQVETGVFLIEAKDIEDATQIARGCPALQHGETVVVRPVGHD